MRRNSIMLGAAVSVLAVAALALDPANAETEVTTHDAAIKACSTVNPLQPVKVLGAVDDGSGIGFSLVWLHDKQGNLWMCDADAKDAVYAYTLVSNDLLDGAGPEMIGLHLTSDGSSDEQPQAVAEKVCAAYLDGGGKVVASRPDGLDTDPGYIVFVKNTGGKLYLCNATGDAMVWAFDPIGDPLSFDDGQAAS
jgi:hypothetical protein